MNRVWPQNIYLIEESLYTDWPFLKSADLSGVFRSLQRGEILNNVWPKKSDQFVKNGPFFIYVFL